MQLVDHLFALADIWCSSTGRSRVALGGIVAADGKFFSRVAAGGSLTTATFEKFLCFFRDGANWPDNVIPQAAVDLLDGLEAIACAAGGDGEAEAEAMPCPSAAAGAAPTGQAGDVSRQQERVS
jgi:hypothetical protein